MKKIIWLATMAVFVVAVVVFTNTAEVAALPVADEAEWERNTATWLNNSTSTTDTEETDRLSEYIEMLDVLHFAVISLPSQMARLNAAFQIQSLVDFNFVRPTAAEVRFVGTLAAIDEWAAEIGVVVNPPFEGEQLLRPWEPTENDELDLLVFPPIKSDSLFIALELQREDGNEIITLNWHLTKERFDSMDLGLDFDNLAQEFEVVRIMDTLELQERDLFSVRIEPTEHPMQAITGSVQFRFDFDFVPPTHVELLFMGTLAEIEEWERTAEWDFVARSSFIDIENPDSVINLSRDENGARTVVYGMDEDICVVLELQRADGSEIVIIRTFWTYASLHESWERGHGFRFSENLVEGFELTRFGSWDYVR
ncbi:MAG: hypothetical protein FWG65_12150 [Turicibacter sp.]|nr:hypothetical protein [Turicibacter sp.]